ncbi:MAG: dihydroorotase [Fuerstiella sp.]|nr:dihydroorotase [Fuerstiella sp.]
MSTTLIQNATVVQPQSISGADVLIDDERITRVAEPGSIPGADEIVNATGLHLIPGVIDDQVHFRDPGSTHKEDLSTGSQACAKGGITTFLEMPNTNPATITLEALDAKLELASTKCVVNYGFYVGATVDNVEVLQQASRTPGIKIFIGSSTGNLLVDQQEALERIFAETQLPVCAHCEDETTIRANTERIGSNPKLADHSRIRDHKAALVATKRAVDLADRHQHRFHVLHVSTAQEAEFLNTTSDLITAEACPHHLLFDIDDYERLGSLVQMNPSIKTADDCAALWDALRAGIINVIATDHAPHTLQEKSKPYPQSPSGLPAVENSLALMLNAVNQNRCTLEQVVRWMCESPAAVWNIRNKGRIQQGFDADIVLVDMQKQHTIRNEEQLTKCGWSPWNGVTLTGQPVRTWVMGQTVFANGNVNPEVRGQEALYDR